MVLAYPNYILYALICTFTATPNQGISPSLFKVFIGLFISASDSQASNRTNCFSDMLSTEMTRAMPVSVLLSGRTLCVCVCACMCVCDMLSTEMTRAMPVSVPLSGRTMCACTRVCVSVIC